MKNNFLNLKKMKLNKITKKLFLTVIFVIALSVVLGFWINTSQAIDDKGIPENGDFISVTKAILSILGGLLYGLVGLVVFPILLISSIVLLTVNAFLSVFVGGHLFSPEKIFTNYTSITNLMNYVSPDVRDASGLQTFALNVSAWFRVFFLFSLSMLLGVLIYLAIKTLLSSVGTKKADIKQMLTNWLISVFILFGLTFIIVGAIIVNDILIKIITNSLTDSSVKYFRDIYANMFLHLLDFTDPLRVLTSILFIGSLTLMTIKYFLAYIYRMIKVGFLIMIAPFIAVTYSIDKAGDNKAQAFSKWMEEFLSTVFIQPIHLLIFSLLIGASSTAANSGNSVLFFLNIPNPTFLLISIVALKSMDKIEKLILSMFKLSGSSSIDDGSALLKVATFGALVGTGSKIMKTLGSGEKNNGKVSVDRSSTSTTARTEASIPIEGHEVKPGSGINTPKSNAENQKVAPKLEDTKDDLDLEGVEFYNPEEEAKKEVEEAKEKKPRLRKLAVLSQKVPKANDIARFYVNSGIGVAGMAFGTGRDGYAGTFAGLAGGFAGSNAIYKKWEERKKIKNKRDAFQSVSGESADKVVDQASEYEKITGEELIGDNAEAKKNLENLMNDVKKFSDSKDMKKELNEALKRYKEFLQDRKGMTKLEASNKVKALKQELMKNEYRPDEDSSEEEKEFARLEVISNMSYERSKVLNNYKDFKGVSESFDVLVHDRAKELSGDIDFDDRKLPIPISPRVPILPPPENKSDNSNPNVAEVNKANRELHKRTEIYDIVFRDEKEFLEFLNSAESEGVSKSEILSYKDSIEKQIDNSASKISQFQQMHDGTEEYTEELTDYSQRAINKVQIKNSDSTRHITSMLENEVKSADVPLATKALSNKVENAAIDYLNSSASRGEFPVTPDKKPN